MFIVSMSKPPIQLIVTVMATIVNALPVLDEQVYGSGRSETGAVV
jgi:hypothetical protein